MILALLLAFAQLKAPGKPVVGYGVTSGVCSEAQGISTITAGQSYELVFFVDGHLRYRTLEVFLKRVHGLEHSWGQSVSDQLPVCLSGPNAGKRAHILPLTVRAAGLYRLDAVIRDDPARDGTVIDRLRVTVQ